MSVIAQMWCGIPLQITEPMVAIFPRCLYDDFPDNCCGAGDGWGEKLVPDYILIPQKLFSWHRSDRYVKISPACAVHDMDWDFARPSWDDFHEANSRLFANVRGIIQARTKLGSNTQNYALRFPAIYAQAVDTLGRKIFWNIKKEQGHPIPASAAWLL